MLLLWFGVYRAMKRGEAKKAEAARQADLAKADEARQAPIAAVEAIPAALKTYRRTLDSLEPGWQATGRASTVHVDRALNAARANSLV